MHPTKAWPVAVPVVVLAAVLGADLLVAKAAEQVVRLPAISPVRRRALRVAALVVDQDARVVLVVQAVVQAALAAEADLIVPVVQQEVHLVHQVLVPVQVLAHLARVVASLVVVAAAAVPEQQVPSVAGVPRAKHVSRSGRNVQNLSCVKLRHWVA